MDDVNCSLSFMGSRLLHGGVIFEHNCDRKMQTGGNAVGDCSRSKWRVAFSLRDPDGVSAVNQGHKTAKKEKGEREEDRIRLTPLFYIFFYWRDQ